MQTITTKYFGPTNHRAARIKATASGGLSVTTSYDYDAQSRVDNHINAMKALCAKLNWRGLWHIGDNANGFTFVMQTTDQVTT